MDKKINVCIIFGGRSAEHEVSVHSAKNVYDAIDKNKYNVIKIGITKNGEWILDPYISNGCVSILNEDGKTNNPLAIIPGINERQIIDPTGKREIEKIDVIFPILHGSYGEDGTIQGLFKILNVPFIGAGVIGSAVGMDKEAMKRLLKERGIPNAKYKVLYKYPEDVKNPDFNELKDFLGLPFFVKPACLGSSVGISKVYTEEEFNCAVTEAFKFDNKIIVEMNIVGREIECSVLGNDNPIASLPGEIITNHCFYTYEAKYLDENGAILKIPAELPPETVEKIQKMAIDTFNALYAEGMARVDFFLTKEQEVIVNEINTIPGFTNISMYPKLWEVSGISYTELIDKLIMLAIEKFERDNLLKTSV